MKTGKMRIKIGMHQKERQELPIWLILGICSFVFAVFLKEQTCRAASLDLGKDWVSVTTNESFAEDTFYYIKYGNLPITRNRKGIYIEDKLVITYKHGGEAYVCYGGVFTNGEDVLYQDGKGVYLYKDCKKKVKLFSLKRKSDILAAVYGDTIYYGRESDYDLYALYRYDLKTKKSTKTGYFNGYYCHHQYLVINGEFHEGVETELILYNMKNGTLKTVTKRGIFGNAVIISGTKVYYTEYDFEKGKSILMTYDLKTKKKQRVKKHSGAFFWIDSRHYFCSDGDTLYVYDVKTGKMETY